VDLPLIDLTSDRTGASLDPQSAEGLTLAARGDWHAAAESFAVELTAAELAGDDVRLAVALTNLGQARAHLGAMDDAAALLARSVEARMRLVAAGEAGPSVAMRGLVDVAAVRAAAYDPGAARDALHRARALSDGSDAALMYVVAQGIALLDDATRHDAVLDEPFAEAAHAAGAPALALAAIDAEAWEVEPAAIQWAVDADAEPEALVAPADLAEPEEAGVDLHFLTVDALDVSDVVDVAEPPVDFAAVEAFDVAAVAAFDVEDVADLADVPAPEVASSLPWIVDDAVEEPVAVAEPGVTLIVEPPALDEIVPASLPPAAPPAAEGRWWQRLGRRGRA